MDRRVCFPMDLVSKVLHEMHSSPLSGHLGVLKTYDKVSKSFYWKGIWGDVKKFVMECASCQKNKDSHQLPSGLLHPLPIPDGKWTHISMDFITGLPKTKHGWDQIFVVIDRLTKSAHFMASKTTYGASHIAKQFLEHVFKIHGLPLNIVCDRDTKFMGTFWRS